MFTQMIVASVLTAEGRINLMNQNVNYLLNGQARKETLASRSELRKFVQMHFGFDLPELETIAVPSLPGWK